jgi:aminopeptidase
MNEADRLARYAHLTVSVGANVQPGQLVVVLGTVEHAPLMREIAREAYRAGARLVEPYYQDRRFTRAQIQLGPEEALGETAPWLLTMMKTLSAEGGAYIQVTADAEPTLFADLPSAKAGKWRPREFMAEWGRVIGERSVNWTIVASPSAGWAEQVFGKPDVEALWQAVEKAVRLDREDPAAAWREHIAKLKRTAGALTQRHFDSLRYRGPGTDFTVGLLPSSRWVTGDSVTLLFAISSSNFTRAGSPASTQAPARTPSDPKLRRTPMQAALERFRWWMVHPRWAS